MKKSSQRGEILAAVLTAISAGLLVAGALTGSQIAQKTTPDFRTTAAGTTWNQCNDAHDNLPCGSCLINTVDDHSMTFGCELLCPGSADNCPGGKGTKHPIEHVYERCKKASDEPCGWTSTDLIGSITIPNGGPWEIVTSQAVNRINGNGTFPKIDCGRVQVDVKMTDTGTKVAGKYFYNTGKDCDGTPAPPQRDCATYPCPVQNYPNCTVECMHCSQCKPTPTLTPTAAPAPPVTAPTCNSKGGECLPLPVCIPYIQELIPGVACPPYWTPFGNVPQVCCGPKTTLPPPAANPTATPSPTLPAGNSTSGTNRSLKFGTFPINELTDPTSIYDLIINSGALIQICDPSISNCGQ